MYSQHPTSIRHRGRLLTDVTLNGSFWQWLTFKTTTPSKSLVNGSKKIPSQRYKCTLLNLLFNFYHLGTQTSAIHKNVNQKITFGNAAMFVSANCKEIYSLEKKEKYPFQELTKLSTFTKQPSLWIMSSIYSGNKKLLSSKRPNFLSTLKYYYLQEVKF